MAEIIGVRFRTAGKIYYFSPGDREIRPGDHVIVETARGVEYGNVVLGNREVPEGKVVQPLKTVLRMAAPEDETRQQENRAKEKEAFQICREKIRRHNLEMKLIDVEYTFDNNKILFYFTADGRVDFRELVKDLASVFKTRIELRQVGVRDETKIMGGVGICGRPFCCHTYLSEFIPVSIRMAKEQNLSLNPTKISGVCGRLMCCLKNEEETYEYLNGRLPSNGDYVTTNDGLHGEVSSVNIFRQTVKVLVQLDGEEKEIREYQADQLEFKPRKKKGRGGQNSQNNQNGQGETESGGEASAAKERTEKPERKKRQKSKEEKSGEEKSAAGKNRKFEKGRQESREEKEMREGRENHSDGETRQQERPESGTQREQRASLNGRSEMPRPRRERLKKPRQPGAKPSGKEAPGEAGQQPAGAQGAAEKNEAADRKTEADKGATEPS